MATNNSNLLKEAIADAKAVRATALANAKAALEEAFNQRFSAVFADKLREDSAAESEAPVTPMAENKDKDPVGATKPSKDKNDAHWKQGDKGPGGNIVAAGKPESKKNTPTNAPAAAKDGGDATKNWSDGNKSASATPDAKNQTHKLGEATQEEGTKVEEQYEEEGKKEEEENVEETVTNEDLDEIIKELQAEAGEAPMDDPAAAGGAEPPAPEAPPAEEPPAEEATEIHSGDTVTISKVEAPAAAGAGAPPVEPAPEAPPAEEEGMGGPVQEEDIDLNELLASLNEEAKEEEGKKHEEEEEEEAKMDDPLNALKTQLAEAIAQRDEAYSTVGFLKKQINEINMLNAKLLYTNKLFKEYGMNREQKTKVVESFDLTKNVREVKLTYANWCESLNFGGKAQRRPQAAPAVTTITEGAASKTVASTKPAKEIITESFDEQARRFQKLAGINVKK